MRSILLLLFISIYSGSILEAQQYTYWKVSPSAINAPADRQLPSQFTTVELNEQQLRQLALEAPLEFSPEAAQHGIIVALPMPDGSLERFEVVESPLLPTKLSMKFPKIRSYRGTSLDHPEWVTRFGLTYRGFHGAIRTPSGTVAIDHLYDEPSAYYMSYYSNDSDLEHSFRCGVGNTVIDDNDYFGPSPSALASSPANNRTGDAVIFRVYDMALACTGEFANWHGNTVAGVMSAFDAGMNRLNLIFESEMAIRFQLIEDNDELIFTNAATDPFNMANMGRELLGQNQAFLDGVVGLENYDIGHIFTGPCSDVGGVVSGATCTNGKGRGVTCNFSANVTGAVANIMAHEVGHQFSAGHTWSNCPGNEGQLASGSAFEPGSGTTIMSYAGACGNQNIQFNSDEYFHVGSLTEMTNFVESAGTCNDFITPVNTYPEFDWPYTDGFYIPVNTYFELEAPATDMDGDDLTYCWEQYNLGPTSPIGTPFANAPSFRSFPPTSSPKRFFPRLQNILTNTSTDFEVLPKISRRMTFRCTVRDNNEEVGGNVFREVDFEATETAGPFRVSHPDLDPVTWEAGDYTEVTWNVASTDNSLVNCKEVNILLSTDGGQSFPFVLAANAPNDGSQFITVPDVETTFARVRVEAANNIFFDINSANFEIIPATTPGYTFEALPYIQDICLPEEINISLSSGSVLGYDSLITLSVDGLPDGAMAEFSTNPITPSDDAMLIINTEEVDVTGIFEVEIMAVAPSADTSFRTVILDIVSNDFSSLALVEPSNGTNGAPEVPEFSWVGSDNALTYIIDIATSPSFDPATIVETGEGISGTEYIPTILLEKNTPYFWRVRPVNRCGTGEATEIFAFHTETLSCASYESTNVPVNIPFSGLPVVESEITVLPEGTISDINLPLIKGQHDLVKHLDVSLISPSGKEVVLFSDLCGNTQLFNIGLDDQAPSEIPCPPIGGQRHIPQNPLSEFVGESSAGPWTLKLAVVDEDGQGGGLEDWSLQLCTNVSLNAPFFIVNDTLGVPPGQTNTVTKDFLQVGDDDNEDNELVYTIVSLPRHGELLRINTPMTVGSTFTQESINVGNVRYRHDGSNTQFDDFTFAVSDNEGGWIGTPKFNFKIDEDAIVGTYSPDLDRSIRLYPNPTQNVINVLFDSFPAGGIQLSLLNIQGQLIRSEAYPNLSSSLQMNTSNLADGLYLLRIETEAGAVTKKFAIQR